MHTLHVDLGQRSYPVYIGRDLFADGTLLSNHVPGSQLVLVSNETVAPLYMDRVRDALRDKKLITEVILPDGEQYKTMDTLAGIFDRVMADGHNRSTTFVAVGGGVVGDITGFAAACYQRGVNFVQIPTTLLAQVDSSVGGKTAVNHPLGKNMIGAFHQPQAVLIDINTLQTLPAREFAAGLAEVIKYGLIADSPFYRWLQDNMPKILAREEAALAEAIVKQVKLRGPFRSLGEFVNRRLTTDPELARYGALQAALEDPDVEINDNYRSEEITANDLRQVKHSANYKFQEAALGSRYQGTPAYISQADILTPIAPIINARSDSFLVRGYGEARSADGQRILARAWCEAVVQRIPDYLDPVDEAFTPRDELKSEANKLFGRRFIVKLFRWIPAQEIEAPRGTV